MIVTWLSWVNLLLMQAHIFLIQIRCTMPQTDWIKSSSFILSFRGYLKYRKCCIDCFVILLLSEPDKQNTKCGLLVQKTIINLIQDTKLKMDLNAL